MVTLAATELEGGGTPSDTLDHLQGSLPLPWGGEGFVRHCEAAAQWAASLQRCRGRRNQGGGGVSPLEERGATEWWPTPEEEAAEVARAGTAGGGQGIILSKTR